MSEAELGPKPRNLGDVLVRCEAPDKVVLIETSADGASARMAWTAAALDEAVDAAARGLLRDGLSRGDKVGVLSANRSEFVIAYLGAMRAGVVIVPINWKLPAETVAYICDDSRIALMLVDEARATLAPDGIPAVSFDRPGWPSLLDPGPFTSVEPAPDEVAQILYTSGSTGRPKGVPLSHAGQLWAVEAASTEDVSVHRLLVAAPMFHMNALFNLKYAFRNRACLVLMPSFAAGAYVTAIEAHHVTWLTSVPTMLAMVANEVGAGPPPAAFGDVTRVYMGSSPFGHSLLERVRSLFPNAMIANGYGTTEAGPLAFGPHPDGLPTPDLSVGFPLASVELRLVDEAGKVVEEAGTGILQIRSPALMPGYLNRPEQSEAALRNGWYHTNDVMRRDEDGFCFFVGRADDMFVSGGENIYPGEVEKLLERHPGVQQAVVVQVADEVKQALPFAFVVSTPTPERPGESDIRNWALAHGPAYQHPRWVEFLDAMPLAGTNKIDRRVLRDRAGEIASRRGR